MQGDFDSLIHGLLLVEHVKRTEWDGIFSTFPCNLYDSAFLIKQDIQLSKLVRSQNASRERD
jgi:hypothetical protein